MTAPRLRWYCYNPSGRIIAAGGHQEALKAYNDGGGLKGGMMLLEADPRDIPLAYFTTAATARKPRAMQQTLLFDLPLFAGAA